MPDSRETRVCPNCGSDDPGLFRFPCVDSSKRLDPFHSTASPDQRTPDSPQGEGPTITLQLRHAEALRLDYTKAGLPTDEYHEAQRALADALCDEPAAWYPDDMAILKARITEAETRADSLRTQLEQLVEAAQAVADIGGPRPTTRWETANDWLARFDPLLEDLRSALSTTENPEEPDA